MTREQAINSMISHGFTVEQTGEIIKAVTPQFSSGLDKNSKKLEKGTTKNDCEHCSKTYGTLGCCDFVSNEPVYSCKEGHEEYARGISKLGATTQNDLGVDCISRADAIRVASGYCHPSNVAKELAKLPSVTPQEPRKGHWINTANPRMSDNIVCSECGYDSIADFKFCPCCGADMREVKE